MEVSNFIKKIWAYIQYVYTVHMTESYIAPWGAAPVTLTTGAGAYNWGAYSADIIAAGALSNKIILVQLNIANADSNTDYEISIVYGASDTECAQAAYERSVATDQSDYCTISSIPIPAGSRVRARARDGSGGNTVNVKLSYRLVPLGL